MLLQSAVRVTLGIALSASLVSWLVVGETSPLADYFLWHVEIRNLWLTVHRLPYLIVLILRPPFFEDAVEYLLVFLQLKTLGCIMEVTNSTS